MGFWVDQPHKVNLLAIPITLLIGYINRDEAFNFNVHDTYFGISYLYLAIPMAILFGIIGCGYWMMFKANRRMSKWLNRIHVLLTFGGILVVWILSKLYRDEIMEYEFNDRISLAIFLVILLVIVGQLIFPINIIYGLIKKKNHG